MDQVCHWVVSAAANKRCHHPGPPPAVVKFARATGDIHALSTADIRLIALAHGLEVAAHGSGHLHDLPELPKVQKKKVHDAKQVRTGVLGGAGSAARAAAPSFDRFFCVAL